MKTNLFSWLAFASLWAVPLPSFATQYEFETCKTSDFSLKYNNLVSNERAIGEAFNKMVSASGSTNMTDCYFMVPVENGQPVKSAVRRLVMYKKWDRIEIVAGLEKRVAQQHGMIVEYVIKERVNFDGQVMQARETVGLQVCRTPEICQRLGVQL